MVEAQDKQDETCKNPPVITKYRAAADIANVALAFVVERCVPGAKISDLCAQGDQEIENQLSKIYNKKGKKKVEKGIAHPTTISVNEIAAYYSPLIEESSIIQEGDLVKINLGCHIDGYAATTGTTICATTQTEKITGKKADVTLAAWNAFQAAARMMKPGNLNYHVTDMIQTVSEAYQVQPLEGCLSHQQKRHVLDGNKTILNKETVDQKVEEVEFENYDIWGLDVYVSTGEGKPKESELRTTVFKRSLDVQYSLKLKTSRNFFVDVQNRFPTMMFTLRAFQDIKQARLGVAECLKHDLLQGFPVIIEKQGELVAQFKGLVLILPSGPQLLTKPIFDPEKYQSDKSINNQKFQEVMTQELNIKIQKKKEEEPKSTQEEVKKELEAK